MDLGPQGPFFQQVNWKEVHLINGYAVLMAYLSMAIKGLGFLVLTWTTVVLLGGFVSMLDKKDFWCLTFITLVQMAGIFDGVLNEKLIYLLRAFDLLLAGGFVVMAGDPNSYADAFSSIMNISGRILLAVVLTLVQVVMLSAVLFPLVIIYLSGILISGGISLWRLIEHDYSGSDGKEASNLLPAMDILYYLALLQAVLFCYRLAIGRMGERVVKYVATECDDSQQRVVSNYLRETRKGSEKDPSFVDGRNLITHAVDMIGSNSPVDCISGVTILYTAICIAEKENEKICMDQRILIKHLVVYAASSRHILQKLLEMLDSRGLHDMETRNQAAKIVWRLAYNIDLEQFPQGIQYISSLIGTIDQYSIAQPYHRDFLLDKYGEHWKLHARYVTRSPEEHTRSGKAWKELLLHGLYILQRLATDGKNSRVISNTPNLVSKIMAPVTSDLLHNTTEHGRWSDIIEGSMGLMRLLSTTPGETRANICQQISSCQGTINTLWRILNCNECNEGLQLNAIRILKQVSMNTQFSREHFAPVLVKMFTQDNKYLSLRQYAGRALWEELCLHGGINNVATIVVQTGGGHAVHSLTNLLLHDSTNICRQTAAEILDHLCTHYTNDDECLGELKKAMTGVMPKVIEAILHYGRETTMIDATLHCEDGKNKENEVWDDKRVFQTVWQSVSSTTLLSSLLILCGTVHHRYLSELVPDLVPHLYASSFLDMLKEVVAKKRDQPTIENLSVLKAISTMVISIMKHCGTFVQHEDLKRLIDALSGASENMLDLDCSMVFSSASMIEDTTSKLDWCTFASLVKDAQELLATLPSTS